MATVDLQQELEALERVLFRLASADDARLLLVLQALLPQLLRTFPSTAAAASDPLAQQLQEKVLQVIAHVKTRLQALASPAMPLRALVQVLREPAASPFAHTFALLFIDIGFRAASADEHDEVLAGLFAGLEGYAPSQQETFFRLLLRALPVTGDAVYPPPTPADPVPNDAPGRQLPPSAAGSMEALLDFVLDFVLYDGSSASSSSDAAATTAAFGLSLPRLERLQRVLKSEAWSRDALYAAQLHALRFVKELAVPTAHKLALYVAGCASTHHSVKSFSAEQLAHVLKHDFAQLEDPHVARRLLALCLGSHAAASSGHEALALSLRNRSRLADASLLQALALLAESKAAANAVPLMLQLLCHVMFGAEPARPANVASRVRLAGVRLCHWTFVHADRAVVERLLGPVLLPTLLRVLMDPGGDSDRAFRQGVYDALAVLGTRAPGLVAGSEQAFQVLLVRCLVEEEQRTGAGANALKAFTSLARAYGAAASEATNAVVRRELTDLLRGARVFDAAKNYARVRAALATWCGDLLLRESAGASNVAMRFALLKLGGDVDAEVQALATKALYCEPLPPLGAVAAHLRAHHPHADLKRSLRDAGAVASCLRFCLAVLTRSPAADEAEAETDAMVAYFVQTLVGGEADEALAGDAAARSAMYEAAAASLVEISAVAHRSVANALALAMPQLLDAACISTDRSFLQHVAALVQRALAAEGFAATRAVDEVVQRVSRTLEDPKASAAAVASLQYVLGSALAVLSAAGAALSDAEMVATLAAYRKLVALLAASATTCANFASFPRGDEDQNARVDFLRSLLDGAGLSGSLAAFLSTGSLAAEWVVLKRQTLGVLQQIVAWDLGGLSSDGGLKLKLAKLQCVAIENLSRAVAGLPSTATGELAALTSSLKDAVGALLKLGSEHDAELQLLVGEALVTIGSHDADADDPSATFAANRAAAIFARLLDESAASRQPTMRRSATMWLLCVCAAGLSAPEDGAPVPLSWRALLRSEAAAHRLIATHEFFVTMLNDSSSVAKESAVKGLAYLRLRAPSAALGDQFSDSLFRRLRCFRAFAPPSAAGVAGVAGVDAEDVEDVAAPPPANAPPATAAASATVENAAYREVSNLAADVGDPELMYALLYLSTSDPIWETVLLGAGSDSAVFAFAAVDRAFRQSIVATAGTLWTAESSASTNKLVPWLFLLKSHANAKVAAVMARLWLVAKGECANEQPLLQRHWRALLRFLLSRVEGSRNFRYREAACVALVELLNGADADQVRADLRRLWQLAAAAVDDVVEAVGLAGLRLFRFLGELSLRVAAHDEPCRQLLLQFLVADGLVRKNAVCRALALDVLLRLVKTLPAAALQDALAALVLKLLEYLSSLELPELQYAQFHVEKKEQLERLRVSLSQSGPVGQLLELAMTRLKELAGSDACVALVDELARGAAGLLRFGVGLNTRVGTANLVATLAAELPFELRKCRGAELLLAKVFVPFVGLKAAAENAAYGDEQSRYAAGLADGLVVQTYCRAAAYLCPLVDAPLVAQYVRAGVFAAPTPSPDGAADANRFLLVTALATKELVAKLPPAQPQQATDWYCTHVFPGAFIGQFAATDVLRATWTAVLEELPPSVRYAEAAIDATLAAVARFLVHSAWDVRRQAALALHALFASPTSSYRRRITGPQTARIWRDLVDAVPGRLWTGKGVVLEALVALASVRPAEREPLAALLLRECERAWRAREPAYLESALQSFGALSAQLPAEQAELRLANFAALRSALLVWLGGGGDGRASPELQDEQQADAASGLPPLLVKCAFEALALAWPSTPLAAGAGDELATDALRWLCEAATRAEFNAWSVRKAVFEALRAVVASAPATALAARHTAQLVLDTCCGECGVRDAKYSMVRVAAASGLAALTKRHGAHHELALLLTVHREHIAATLDVLRGSEEPAEQRAAFETMTNLLELHV